MPAAVKVLLVEDVEDLRMTVRRALRVLGRFDVVDVADGASAIAAAAEHRPDVVVLDLGLPDLAGQEVVTRIRSVAPEADIVVYTGTVPDDRSPVAGRVEAVVGKDRDISYLVGLIADFGSRPRTYASLVVEADRTQVAVARRFVAQRCREWGCGSIVDEALVIASELVTNGIIHGGGGSCELRVAASGGVLRLQVVDGGSGTPDPRAAGRDDEHGRGLLLVSAMCAAWGVDPLPEGGKVVWAEMLAGVPRGGDAEPVDVRLDESADVRGSDLSRGSGASAGGTGWGGSGSGGSGGSGGGGEGAGGADRLRLVG